MELARFRRFANQPTLSVKECEAESDPKLIDWPSGNESLFFAPSTAGHALSGASEKDRT